MKRKIIQIVASAVSDENGTYEYLYALDSTGQMWEHYNATSTLHSGWVAMEAPWDDPRVKKQL